MKSRAERPASQDVSAALKRRGDAEPSSNCVRPSHMHAAIQTEVCGYLHRGMRTKQKTWTDMFAFLYTLLYTNTHHSYELEFGSHPCTNPLLLCLLSFSFSFLTTILLLDMCGSKREYAASYLKLFSNCIVIWVTVCVCIICKKKTKKKQLNWKVQSVNCLLSNFWFFVSSAEQR